MEKKAIDQLADEVKRHNQLYWIDHKPEISDVEYDKLVKKLQAVAPFHPILSALIEDASPDKVKVKHLVPMLSLGKVFTVEEIADWATKAGSFGLGKDASDGWGITVSYKVDGSSCSLLYENGKLVRAATRGDGEEGDDITANVLVINGVPKTIDSKKKVEVRGEVYMTNASFREAIGRFEEKLEKGQAKEDDRPSNPRNYCAGSLKQKDAAITRERNLSFLAHGCILHEGEFRQVTEDAVLKALEKLGFETPYIRVVDNSNDIDKMIKKIDVDRKKLPYETDGVVLAINHLAKHKDMGFTAHHPRFRLAYKFAREQGETTVICINWETARTGIVAPTMQVKPISLGGATVNYCTIHNAKTVRDENLCAGDKIVIEREVIPCFVQKNGGSTKPELPTKCKTCGEELEWDENETHLVCPNVGGCPAQQLSYLEHYVSRNVVNMMGVGDELISKLFEAGLVKTPADFYKLTEKMILDNIPRSGPASAKKVIASIQNHRAQTLNTFLQSLGIKRLGERISDLVAEHFGDLMKILGASKEDLMKVPGVADGIATAIHDGLLRRKDLIIDLCKHVEIEAVKKVQGPLTGKSFCLTGHIEVNFDGKKLDSRPAIEDLIKSKGGAVKGFSKNISFLVVGADAGGKLDQAKKANVKIIDGAELEKMLG